jgi:hypothetical protein
MAPELAIAYVAGWAPSLAVSGLHLYLQRKRYQSVSYKTVQSNLRQVNLSWSDTESDLHVWSEESSLKDRESSRRTIFTLAAFSFFLSWAGMFFHLIVIFSLHVFAVSRLEKAVFSSKLSQRPLSAREAQAVLSDLKDRGLIKI